jgi:hypothetical protein
MIGQNEAAVERVAAARAADADPEGVLRRNLERGVEVREDVNSAAS